ncbi:MAG: Lrp/AsnC family transcriptional regulator, partial [Candidatus Micrarchaeota archaeon]|nr:Lrp/AsnC family transcriptional regulator [Candidatus Micrarchaeota archaeon]
VAIAKSAGISPDAVSKRIRQLEKAGVISHYAIWPNANKLAGAYYKVLLSLRNLDSEKEKRLLAFCREHPNIVYVVSTVGPWQFEMDVEIEDSARFRELMRNFLKRFSGIVSDYAALDIYEERKFRFFEKELIEGKSKK